MLVWLIKKLKYTIFIITMANIKKTLVPKKYTNPAMKVLVYYYKYLKVFSQKEADKLVEY